MYLKFAVRLLKLIGVILVAIASKIWQQELTFGTSIHPDRPSFLLGVVALCFYVVTFLLLYRWLYYSKLQAPVMVRELTAEQQHRANSRRQKIIRWLLVAMFIW